MTRLMSGIGRNPGLLAPWRLHRTETLGDYPRITCCEASCETKGSSTTC
jgi:hypothetical protein